MPTDLYINGTQYPDRSGSDKFGTFYSQCQPPVISGTTYGGANFSLVDGDLEIWTGASLDNWTENWNLGSNPFTKETTNIQNGAASAKILFNSPSSNQVWLRQDLRGICGNWSGLRTYTITGYIYGTAGWKAPFRFKNSGGAEFGSGTYTIVNTNTWEQFSYVFTDTDGTSRNFADFFAGTNTISGAGSLVYLDNLVLTISGAAGSVQYTMDSNWGARIAENTGRVRGLSGFGTIDVDGTFSFTFPSGWFKFQPQVEVNVKRKYIKPTPALNSMVGNFFTDNWNDTQQVFVLHQSQPGNYFEPRPQIFVQLTGTTGFKCTGYWALPTDPLDDSAKVPIVFSWHAKGI